MFIHKLGVLAASKITGFKGIITARMENLSGLKRYYLQPRMGRDMKVPKGRWFDENDLTIIGTGQNDSKYKK